MADIVFFVLTRILSAAISILMAAMFLRVLISFFVDPMDDSKLSSFLYAMTEPIIYPMRALCAKLHWFEGLPLDMPFMITFMLLSMIDLFLSML